MCIHLCHPILYIISPSATSDDLHNPPDSSTLPFMRSNYRAKYFSKLFALRYPRAKFTAENYKECNDFL